MSVKVLLIEDNPDHILLTKRILEKADQGYQLDSVSEAKEGIRKIIEESYDLILCDYRLPRANALDIIKEIKTKGIDLPFIAITALGSEKIAVELMKEGAYDYIIKDASYEDALPMVIKRSIERYKMKKDKEDAEKALRESEAQYRGIFNSTTDSFLIFDLEGNIVEANSQACKMYGYSYKELTKLSGRDIVHPDHYHLFGQFKRDVQKSDEFYCESVDVRKDGSSFNIEVRGTEFNYKDGKHLLAVIRDITERKRIERELVFQRSKLEAILQSIDCGIDIVSYDYKVQFQNSFLLDRFGDLRGKFCYREYMNKDKPCSDCSIRKAIENNRVERTEVIAADGLNYELVSTPIKNHDGTMSAVKMVMDITERKKAESALADAYRQLKETQEQLIQSGKMAAMGQLAAGISHELNQPLTGIKGFAQAVYMDIDESNPLKEDINKIIEQSDRMDKIIKNIRFFARKSKFVLKEIDINQPIEDALMLLNEQLNVHNIHLEKSLAEGLPQIHADANQLQQVFLNLLTNARDAIDSLKRPEGGKITIKSLLSEDKKHVEVMFEDDGRGIPGENLEHIFNPFFTTKSPDGGMGIGLSIVYRIIENHKGGIKAESEEGKGTKFKITMPALDTDETAYR